jgi:outer membrane protein assembly factor BamB
MNVQRLTGWLAAGWTLGACAIVMAQSDADHNWHQWRGPAGNGIVQHGNPPTEWSESKNIVWKSKIPGQGHGTPVIWGDKIFLLSAVPTGNKAAAVAPTNATVFGQQRPERRGGSGQGRGGSGRSRGGGRRAAPTDEYAYTTFCLDRKTGDVVWERIGRAEVPHQGVQSSSRYSAASAVTDGERVYSSFGSSGLFVYDMDGNLQWSKDLGKVSVTFGEAASPGVKDGVLIVIQDNNGDSFVYAFDAKSGKQIWKKSRDEGSGWTTPYFMDHGGKSQVVINGSSAVRSYELKTGDLLWQCSGLGSNPVPVLVSDEKSVYAMSGHRNGAAIAINLGGSGDLTHKGGVRWTITRGTPYVPSPLLYDGLLLFCQRNDAILTCVNPETGEPYYEQERVEGAGGIYASPVGVNGNIYLPTQNGVTLVLKNSKELTVVAKNKLGEGIDASPVVIGDQLFLRGHEHLYCIGES